MPTRRNFITRASMMAATPLISKFGFLDMGMEKKFHIGICDWSMGKNSNIEAFDLAKNIGVEGLMVSLGSEKNDMHLRQKSLQQDYLDASKRTGIKIASMGITELNNIPYKSDPRTVQWVWDSVDVAAALGVTVVLLPFFVKNDLREDAAGKKEVISRLREVAPHAEKNGVILGIESYLNAAEHLEIMDKVGSSSVKAYMDFRNTADAGFDIFKEVRQLGKENICELHMKENGFLLGQGTIPWEKIRDLIYEIGYYGDGWMQMEWSIPKNAHLVESYRKNLTYLRTLFQKEI